MGLAEGLSYAARLNALARATADCRAGVSAFLSKTDPPWRSSVRGIGGSGE
jgi:methylglutaconyl-CoA hydratase